MKRFALLLAVAWSVVFFTVVYLSIASLKQPEPEKSYLDDRSEIYY